MLKKRVGGMPTALALLLLSAILPTAIVKAPASAAGSPVVQLVSTNADGSPASAKALAISPNARYVALSDGLIQDDYVKDRVTGSRTSFHLAPNGDPGDNVLFTTAIANNGNVAFLSGADNLTANDSNGHVDLFFHDSTTGQTTRFGGPTGQLANGVASNELSMTPDGRFVVFLSDSPELPGANGYLQTYRQDRQANTLTLVSATSGGAPADGNVAERGAGNDISDDGQEVIFITQAVNLATTFATPNPGSYPLLYLKNVADGSLRLISRSSFTNGSGTTTPIRFARDGGISGDGRTIIYQAGDNPGDNTRPFGALMRYDVVLSSQDVVLRLPDGHPLYAEGNIQVSGDGAVLTFLSEPGLIPDAPAPSLGSLYYEYTLRGGTFEAVNRTSAGLPFAAACCTPWRNTSEDGATTIYEIFEPLGDWYVWRAYVYGPPVLSTSPPRITADADIVASPSDQLLQRAITFHATTSSGTSVARYEYGWASYPTAVEPVGPLQKFRPAVDATAVLDYRATLPSSTATLMVRVVDTTGSASPWKAQQVPTPNKPLLVALGDSITSGHHRESRFAKTQCDDPSYGYPQYVWNNMESLLPLSWQANASIGYVNLAHSGFSTAKIIAGNAINACNRRIVASPLATAQDRLQQNTRNVNGKPVPSWDRVVVTAGIDDTNWEDVVRKIVNDYVFDLRFDTNKCEADISKWDGSKPIGQDKVKAGVGLIAAGLRSKAPAARIIWLSYYDIAGTGTSDLRDVPAVPPFCDPAMANATALMRRTLRDALPGDVALLDSNLVLGNDDAYLQPLFLVRQGIKTLFRNTANPPGWPHPNSAGAATLASLVSP